jgi:hypothetical protein
MCKEINSYFSGVIDNKESIVVISRNYKGSPMLCYPPAILVISRRIWNKYQECFLFDHTKTNIVLYED